MALRSHPQLDELPFGNKRLAGMNPHLIHYLESVDYERRTGGWVYNNKLVERLQKAGCEVKQLKLPAFFGTSAAINAANFETVLESLPPGSLLIADNLYLMHFVQQVRRRGAKVVSIFHHPISEERAADGTTGGEPELERRALAEASLVICTSQLTAERVFELHGIDRVKVVVAMPGVDLSPPSPEHIDGQWRFLSVGAVVPRKRYEFLIRALADLPDRNWHCTIVGNVTRYPAYVTGLDEIIRRYDLVANISLPGEVDEPTLEHLWHDANMFLFSSAYEGYGMAIAEALRRGLPTITTPAGAVADWASGGVTIVRSDDPAEMATRIANVRNDRPAYLAVRKRALSFGETLPTWTESLRPAADRIKSLADSALA